jgi:hypothetical protein
MTSDVATSRAAPARTSPLTTPAWSLSRLPLLPIAASLAVSIAGAFATVPLRDAVTLHEVADVHLVKPFSYIVLAPLSDVLDALTLLSARQHIAVVLGLLGLWALWRFARPRGTRRRWPMNVVSLITLLASIAAADAAAAYLPRPMAYLASVDPDLLRIDFHSHTKGSGDARQRFSAERNREWHLAGGYDVAYVTDHGTLAEGERGLAKDPATGRDGVILLPGIEVSWDGEHVGLLGSERSSRGLLEAGLHDLDQRGLTIASRRDASAPIVIWNHPRDPRLEKLPFATGATTAGVRAIEISNGAPHGMDLIRQKRQQIVALARRHNLALTSGTDNHGWGYAAPNWTLLRLRDWRGLSHDELATRIGTAIREGGFGATDVVERTTVDPGTSTAALAASVLMVPWRVLTTLSAGERLMWIVWTWAITGVGLRRRRQRARRSQDAFAGAIR